LAKFNFSFDLQLNPHQINDAVSILRENPNIVVIVDHLMSLHLGQQDVEDEKNILFWRCGVQELSKLPNVYMKISMLPFILNPQNNKFDLRVKNFVIEVISLFGTKRCMFASNYPVDKEYIGPHELYSEFKSFVEEYGEEEKKDLFYFTAANAYKML